MTGAAPRAERSGALPATWALADGRALALEPFALMGILNVTPDSFSDGGEFASVDAAADRALAMIDEGATIIDIGAESTRPGATRVSAEEQIRRAVPVIRRIRALGGRGDVPVSIDTTLAEVAAAALDAGADAVNDVSAGQEDEAMLPLVARRGCGVVLMHRVAPPERDRYSTQYASAPIGGDVVPFVRDRLLAAAERALSLGVGQAGIALDPGLGFGKTVAQNWALIARSGELADLGYPLLIGASRKSFVGQVTGVADPARRVVGGAVAAAIAWSGGARIIRTHDVAAVREALGAAAAALSAQA